MNDHTMPDDNYLKRVGKRMPYTTPDDFFNNLEQNILAEVAAESKKVANAKVATKRLLWIMPIVRNVACAAIVAVCGIYLIAYGNKTEDYSVENAFAKLNEADQLFFIDTMQQDLFINDETY